MVHRQPNCACHVRLNQRSGLMAIMELLLVVSALIGLLWMGLQLASNVASDAASSGVDYKGTSGRGVNRISLNQAGDRLWIYRSHDRILQLDLTTGAELQTVPLAGTTLAAVAHSADGDTTLLCGQNGSVLLWRSGSDLPLVDVSLGDDPPIDAAVSADGTVALCVTALGQVVGWTCDGPRVRQFAYDLPGDSRVVRIGLTNSGRRMSLARNDGTVSFHSATTGAVAGSPLHADCEFPAFAWSDDERLMAVASSTGIARTHDLTTGAVIAEFRIGKHGHSGVPLAIVISPDGRRVAATIHTASEIVLGDIASGSIVARLSGHDGIVRTLQFSPTSDRLYSGSYDGTVREWSLASCAQVRIVD